MKLKPKFLFILTITACLLISLTQASAMEITQVKVPFYISDNLIITPRDEGCLFGSGGWLSITGTKASFGATAEGYSSVTKFTGKLYLQEKTGPNSFTTVDYWDFTQFGDTMDYSQTYTVQKGKTYRMYCPFTAWVGSDSYLYSAYSPEKTCN